MRNGLQRLVNLNTWFQLVASVCMLWNLGGVTLLEEVCPWGWTLRALSLALLAVRSASASSCLCLHLSLPVIILASFRHHMNSILWSKKLSKPFPSLSCLWSWLFFFFLCHRKVTKQGLSSLWRRARRRRVWRQALIPVCCPAPTPPCFLKPCSSLW